MFILQAREPRREAYTWSESQDQILVTWSTGEECTMHILVVHAMIILLNYGPGQGEFYIFNLIFLINIYMECCFSHGQLLIFSVVSSNLFLLPYCYM